MPGDNVSCVYCAGAQINKAAHSGKLRVPAPEPGDLHFDLKEYRTPSLHGKFRYAGFYIDEHTRFVMVEFFK